MLYRESPFRAVGKTLGHDLGKNIVDKFTKLNQKGFSMESVEAKFFQFSFWVAQWALIFNSKHFRDFFKISQYRTISSLESFGNI